MPWDSAILLCTTIRVERPLVFRKLDLLSFSIAMLMALVVSGYPFISAFPVFLNDNTRLYGASVRGVILLLSVSVIIFYGVRKQAIYKGALWLPMIIFWVLYLARLVLDTVIHPIILSLPVYEYYVFLLGSCLMPMIALTVRTSKKTIDRAFRYLMILSVAAVFMLLLNIFVLHRETLYLNILSRLGTEFLNPISAGHLAVTVIILATFKLLGPGCQEFSKKLILGALALLSLATLIMTASKGPVLALLAVETLIILSALLRGKRKGRVIALLFVSICSVFLILERYGSTIVTRFGYLLTGGDEAISTRYEIYSLAFEEFVQNPFFGSSIELQSYQAYPHNVIIESFMATGIFGGVAFSSLVILTSLMAARMVLRGDYYAWVGLLYLQYLSGSMLSGALYNSSTMWAMMGAIIGVSRLDGARFKAVCYHDFHATNNYSVDQNDADRLNSWKKDEAPIG